VCIAALDTLSHFCILAPTNMVHGEHQWVPLQQRFRQQNNCTEKEGAERNREHVDSAWRSNRRTKIPQFAVRVQTTNLMKYNGSGKQEVRSDTSSTSTRESIADAIDSEPSSPMTPIKLGQQTESQPTPPGVSSPTTKQATWSVGSKLHHTGGCRPCAWYWKPFGCLNAQECGYCHMCSETEMKNRKRTKMTMMRQRFADAKVHAQVVELPKVEDMPHMEPVNMEEGETHGEQHGKNPRPVEFTEPSVSEDSTSTPTQQRIRIKNTFIHAEFPDILEASALPAEDDFVVTAGVLFRARSSK